MNKNRIALPNGDLYWLGKSLTEIGESVYRYFPDLYYRLDVPGQGVPCGYTREALLEESEYLKAKRIED